METKGRIQSIDALRGFDMFFILEMDRFFSNLDEASNAGFANFLGAQLSRHTSWEGFNMYDTIMPLFLFIVGVVIPVAINKRKATMEVSKIYRHIIWRVIVLWILGMIAQGHLLGLGSEQIHLFSNTLQAIAVGYLIACMAYLHLKKTGRYVLCAFCLILYAFAITQIPFQGQTSMLLPDQSLALFIDQGILGRFDDGTQYTWILTGLGFAATTLLGSFAGEIILNKERSQINRFKLLIYIGLSLMAIGYVWGLWHPIIKKLWTSSMVLFAGGICFILLGLFYYVIDIRGVKKWSFPLRVIGMNAIFAYMLVHVINMSGVASQILFGTEQWLGKYYAMICNLGGFLLVYGILYYMYKKQTFIKI